MTCRMYYGFNSLRSALRVIPVHRWVKQSNWPKVGRGMNGGKSRKEGGKEGRRKEGRKDGRKKGNPGRSTNQRECEDYQHGRNLFQEIKYLNTLCKGHFFFSN